MFEKFGSRMDWVRNEEVRRRAGMLRELASREMKCLRSLVREWIGSGMKRCVGELECKGSWRVEQIREY